MRRRNIYEIIAALWLGLAANLAGCSTSGGSCTADILFALHVTVEDSRTHQVICNASVVATEGTNQETLMGFPATDSGEVEAGPNACVFAGVPDQAGTYDVTASAPGFQMATVRGVKVTQGQCHVIPQSVTVELSPM